MSQGRPFRFGVSIGSAGSRAAWAEKARKLEHLGYATLLVPDHLADAFAPMPALVSAADVTTTLRVGPFVLNNDLRHPALVAREAALVDLLTDGRLELGLGAGWAESEYREAGLSFDPGATRVERLAESVAIVKGLLKGDEVSLAGRHYRVTDHRIHPLPAQRPGPPLLIAGNGRRLLSVAAQAADIIGLSGISFRRGGTEADVAGFAPAAVDARVRWIREAAGDRFDQLELSALVQRVVVTDDRRQAAEELAARWTDLTAAQILQSPHLLLGNADQLVEDLQARRERWGLSYYAVFEPAMDPLAPVVARLAGT